MKKCTLGRQKKIRNENKKNFRNLRLNHIDKSAIALHFGRLDMKLIIQLMY